jgi:exopolysaccharide biosynthesis polyprenyl glycosylphosphotransferase
MIDNYLYYINKTSFRYDIVGHILVGEEKENIGSSKFLGRIEDLETILNENVVDEIIFALPRNYMGAVEKYLLMCEQRGLTTKLVMDLFDLQLSKTCLLSVGTLPVLTYHTISLNSTQLMIKRIMDIVGSLIGLFVLAFLSLFIVPAILLDSKGPVFFKQKRVGQNGRHFNLYKFRSMYSDAEERKKELVEFNKIKDGYMFKIDNDPRITRVGAFLRKTSLDELPQFINVLKGEMSLVGTRPPTIDEVEKYNNPHHRRISIKPGITGMWQISGRSEITDFNKVVSLDTYYIDNWSVWKDFEIITKTIFMLLFRNRGAY